MATYWIVRGETVNGLVSSTIKETHYFTLDKACKHVAKLREAGTDKIRVTSYTSRVIYDVDTANATV